jgi:hypothetical protein
VRALTDAWGLASADTVAAVNDFENTLMNPSKNMKYYRETLPPPSPVAPVLPFVPLDLKVTGIQ